MRMPDSYVKAMREMPRERLEEMHLREASIRGDAELCLEHLGYPMWRDDVLPRVEWPTDLKALDDRTA